MDTVTKRPRLHGPKDWSPTPWLESVLLSPKEIHRTRKIRKEAKEGKPVSMEDALWMTELVRRLSEIGPSDYLFPDYLALVNQIVGSAFALGFVREFNISRRLTLPPTEGPANIQLMDEVISINPPQAALIVRPFLRVNGASSKDTVGKLQTLTLTVWIDGEASFQGSVAPCLIAQDGTFFGKVRPIFRVRKSSSLFPACRLDERQMADASQLEGIFCPNGTRIQAALSGKFDFFVDCFFGVVAGLYSVDSGEVSVHGALSLPAGAIQLPGRIR